MYVVDGVFVNGDDGLDEYIADQDQYEQPKAFREVSAVSFPR